MPSLIALGCLEVSEKFVVGGVGDGWWGGGISTPILESNQLKLGQVDVELGCDNYCTSCLGNIIGCAIQNFKKLLVIIELVNCI